MRVGLCRRAIPPRPEGRGLSRKTDETKRPESGAFCFHHPETWVSFAQWLHPIIRFGRSTGGMLFWKPMLCDAA